jgi:hypothetical protein
MPHVRRFNLRRRVTSGEADDVSAFDECAARDRASVPGARRGNARGRGEALPPSRRRASRRIAISSASFCTRRRQGRVTQQDCAEVFAWSRAARKSCGCISRTPTILTDNSKVPPLVLSPRPDHPWAEVGDPLSRPRDTSPGRCVGIGGPSPSGGATTTRPSPLRHRGQPPQRTGASPDWSADTALVLLVNPFSSRSLPGSPVKGREQGLLQQRSSWLQSGTARGSRIGAHRRL